MVSIKPVTINKSLLTPVKTDIDPTVQVVRTKEKEQIKGLNNRFVSYIQKVQLLEQENKMLETKWQLLQSQTSNSSDTEHMYKVFIDNLQKQLDLLHNDKKKLEQEKDVSLSQLDSYRSKYEDEANRRIDVENDFITLKKDADDGTIAKEELDSKFSSLQDEFNFLRAVYDAEIREMQASLKETSVVLEMDNSRSLDMDQIVSDVKAQYEEIALRSREETETWYRTRFDLLTEAANQHSTDLHTTKKDIAELNRMISRVQHEIDLVKGQRNTIEITINEMETRGENAVLDAKKRIKDLEKALTDAKHQMAKQIKEYQDLMNIKLALDIEISTYRKLMEGEEDRLGQKTAVNVRSAPISSNGSSTPTKPNLQRRKSGPVMIKMVETSDISYN